MATELVLHKCRCVMLGVATGGFLDAGSILIAGGLIDEL